MFYHVAFFRQAFVAANLMCVTSNSPANRSLPPPAPIPAAAQQDVRAAVRPAVQAVSEPYGRDPAPVGNGSRRDGRGWPFDTGGAARDLTGPGNNPYERGQ
jgi:hypothetical protein